MNKSKLKTYAPQARQDFIRMIRQRTDLLGLTKSEIAPARVEGDFAVIEGSAYPRMFAGAHKKLVEKIEAEGIEHLIERAAYSWFNRFAALRFMEVNDFLSHGFRVLSSRDANKTEPEILTHAAEVELPGLDREKIVELKLAGNKDAELYKMLIVAQCNELNRAMPFLFEKIGDETEILLPDNLLATDSVIRKMVASIDEADWSEVEIVGWLYQFYISEKKDEVIGKPVKSEDIPAATQLFTPKWIVKYMTQNSLGRLWRETNPHSQLARNMEFYIEGEREKELGVSQGDKRNDGSESQRLDRVTKGDEFGSDGLLSDKIVSERGALWSDQSSEAGSSLDSIRHSGGTRSDIDGGMSKFSLDSERIAGGSTNTTDDRTTSELYNESAVGSVSGASDRNSQDAQFFDKKTQLEKKGKGIEDESKLPANPYSLTHILNPEELRILDPACGSGHILVEAYELLKLIYTERGYSSRDIPLLILEKNLFGLDIDERAAQMASFALLMKARRDDRRIFERLSLAGSHSSFAENSSNSEGQRTKDKGLIPNVMTVPDSSHLETDKIAELFFSRRDAGQQNAAIPIRDSKFLFGEMETQPPLMMSGNPNGEGQRTKDEGRITEQNISDLLSLFEKGTTLGSLIRIPAGFGAVVDKLERAIDARRESGNSFEKIAARQLEPFVRAAKMLSDKYDCVIANPPYMGGKGMNAELKAFAAKNFPDSKSDLFAMFIERNFELLKPHGFNAMVTMQSWMFLSSYEAMRAKLLNEKTIVTMAHLGARAFVEISGEVVQTTAFVMKNEHLPETRPTFFRLVGLSEPEKVSSLRNGKHIFMNTHQDDFKKIPGSPIAYWVSDKARDVFEKGTPLGEIAKPRQGMATTDNERFLRFWHEINFLNIGFDQENGENYNWFPYNKGGDFRRWYGNNVHVVLYENSGQVLIDLVTAKYPKISDPEFVIKNRSYYFREAVTWSDVGTTVFAARHLPSGYIFDTAGPCLFSRFNKVLLGFLSTPIVTSLLNAVNPTLHFNLGNLSSMPVFEAAFDNLKLQVEEIVEEAVSIARADWDSFETSWDFKRLPMLDNYELRITNYELKADSNENAETTRHTSESTPVTAQFTPATAENNRSTVPSTQPTVQATMATAELTRTTVENTVEAAWNDWKRLCDERIARMQFLETENNRLFIEAYDLQDELAPEVPLEQITLARADAEKDTRRLLSYFIGCLMGRYSLDEKGLIYADAKGSGFDPSRYRTFPADGDGIVPVTDMEWFEQEAANRFANFIRAVFEGKGEREKGLVEEETKLAPEPSLLTPNLRWIAEQLGAKANETPIETVRRYFSTAFFKDHLQTYKKRPIYWLFSSGKQKAFECLVYLHRYSEATLPRMRHEYVLPLMSKITAQIEHTENDIENAETSSGRNKKQKQLEILKKKQTELAAFDEKLRHYSDMRIDLDLDDGIKVNYGKFGDLLAEVKQVAKTGE